MTGDRFHRRPDGFRFVCSYQMSAYYHHAATGREYRYDRPDPGTLRYYDRVAPADVLDEWRRYRLADYLAFVDWCDRRGYWSPSSADIIADHYRDVLAELAAILVPLLTGRHWSDDPADDAAWNAYAAGYELAASGEPVAMSGHSPAFRDGYADGRQLVTS